MNNVCVFRRQEKLRVRKRWRERERERDEEGRGEGTKLKWIKRESGSQRKKQMNRVNKILVATLKKRNHVDIDETGHYLRNITIANRNLTSTACQQHPACCNPIVPPIVYSSNQEEFSSSNRAAIPYAILLLSISILNLIFFPCIQVNTMLHFFFFFLSLNIKYTNFVNGILRFS